MGDGARGCHVAPAGATTRFSRQKRISDIESSKPMFVATSSAILGHLPPRKYSKSWAQHLGADGTRGCHVAPAGATTRFSRQNKNCGVENRRLDFLLYHNLLRNRAKYDQLTPSHTLAACFGGCTLSHALREIWWFYDLSHALLGLKSCTWKKILWFSLKSCAWLKCETTVLHICIIL